MKIRSVAVILAMGLIISSQAYSNDETYGDGVAAYSLQDYEKARAIWSKLAEEGGYTATLSGQVMKDDAILAVAIMEAFLPED